MINNTVFGKTMENVLKNGNIKLVTNQAKRNYIVSESNYHTTTFFPKNLVEIEMIKRK